MYALDEKRRNLEKEEMGSVHREKTLLRAWKGKKNEGTLRTEYLLNTHVSRIFAKIFTCPTRPMMTSGRRSFHFVKGGVYDAHPPSSNKRNFRVYFFSEQELLGI